MYGMVAEMGNCHTHGSFLRKLNEEGLEKVLRYCRSAKPMTYSDTLAGVGVRTCLGWHPWNVDETGVGL